MFWIKEIGMHAGSMRTSSRAETIQVNGDLLDYQL